MKNVRFQLNAEQKSSLYRAFKKYFLPLVLAFLVAIQAGKSVEDALLVIYAGILTMTINFLTKFISEDK